MDDVIDDVELKVGGIFLPLVVDLIIALPPTLPPTNASKEEVLRAVSISRRLVDILIINSSLSSE